MVIYGCVIVILLTSVRSKCEVIGIKYILPFSKCISFIPMHSIWSGFPKFFWRESVGVILFVTCKFTVYIRAYAEQTVTERTDVYRSTRFFVPKMFCTVFHPKLYASNVLLYRPCMSIYYLPKDHNFRHGSLVV